MSSQAFAFVSISLAHLSHLSPSSGLLWPPLPCNPLSPSSGRRRLQSVPIRKTQTVWGLRWCNALSPVVSLCHPLSHMACLEAGLRSFCFVSLCLPLSRMACLDAGLGSLCFVSPCLSLSMSGSSLLSPSLLATSRATLLSLLFSLAALFSLLFSAGMTLLSPCLPWRVWMLGCVWMLG